jgi:enamine deaminase RidA (YjgF/YER057c/UK114 family)
LIRKMASHGLSVLLALAGLTPAAKAAGIERFRADASAPAPLLKGALISQGSALFFVSGQIAAPIDPSQAVSPARTPAEMGDTSTQTISALTKVKAILEAHGYTMADIVKVTVFLVGDPAKGGAMDFAGMNEGFKRFFGTVENPNAVARSTVQVVAVAYPAFLVEIEAIAARAPEAEKRP